MRFESTYCCRNPSMRARRSAENPFDVRDDGTARAACAAAGEGAATSATAADNAAMRATRRIGDRAWSGWASMDSARGLGVLVLPVVLGQQVTAEVVAQVPPHGVDVVGVVLLVVVLDQDRRSVDPVVVRLSHV